MLPGPKLRCQVLTISEQTKGYTLEQLSVVFGDEIVDDEGHHKDNEKTTYTILKENKDLHVTVE